MMDVVLQQVVNGLALGMMYALLALGFTMVYGIIELINFSHFSVFMTGTFVGLTVLNLMGVTAVSRALTGWTLVATLIVLFLVTMVITGLLGMAIERLCLRPLRNVSGTAPMITTIGVAFVLINVMLLTFGPQAQRFPSLLPNWRWPLYGTAEITFKQLVLFAVGLVLMVILSHLVKLDQVGEDHHEHEPHREQHELLEGDLGGAVERPPPVRQERGEALAPAARRSQHDVDEDEGDPDGGDHRRGPGDVAQRAEAEPLDRHPEQAGDDHRDEEEDDQGGHQGPAGQGPGHRGDAHEVQDGEPHEGPGHEDAEVGEVDQLDDAVDHGEAEREQGVHHAEREPVHHLLQDDVHHVGERRPGPARARRARSSLPRASAYFSGATPTYLISPSRHW